MHLIYSAVRDPDQTSGKHLPGEDPEMQIRYQAYVNACDKHRRHLEEIQKYFPNWMPPFR